MLNIFCHWEQLNGSSPVRVLSCIFKWIDIEQLQSHWKQLNDLSLLWVLSCLFKVPDIEHLCPLKGLSPVWALSCLFKWLDIEYLKCHQEQMNVFSLVLTLSCLFKLPDVEEWCITFVGSFLCKFKINSCVLSSMLKTELTYRYKVLFLIMTQTYQSFHMPSKKLS